VRRQSFQDIWKHSGELAKVRSIRMKDLSTCSRCSHSSTCARCPGLAYMEGDMRGPSTADCQQSFAKTGTPSAHMLRQVVLPGGKLELVQIRTAAVG
jgi:sulfatase maturation enzyme AslB (radical SAM superfamily)